MIQHKLFLILQEYIWTSTWEYNIVLKTPVVTYFKRNLYMYLRVLDLHSGAVYARNEGSGDSQVLDSLFMCSLETSRDALNEHNDNASLRNVN